MSTTYDSIPASFVNENHYGAVQNAAQGVHVDEEITFGDVKPAIPSHLPNREESPPDPQKSESPVFTPGTYINRNTHGAVQNSVQGSRVKGPIRFGGTQPVHPPLPHATSVPAPFHPQPFHQPRPQIQSAPPTGQLASEDRATHNSPFNPIRPPRNEASMQVVPTLPIPPMPDGGQRSPHDVDELATKSFSTVFKGYKLTSVIVLLKLVKEASGAAPVPGLRSAAGCALELVQKVAEMKGNKVRLSDLTQHIVELSVMIIDICRRLEQENNPALHTTFQGYVNKFKQTLDEVTAFIKKTKKRSTLGRFFKSSDEKDEIERYKGKVASSISLFQLFMVTEMYTGLNRAAQQPGISHNELLTTLEEFCQGWVRKAELNQPTT